MIIDKDEIIAELNLKPFGQKGWLSSKEPCPFCGKDGKNTLIFTDDGHSAVFHCFKCGTKTSIRNYLIKMDRKDLIRNDYQMSKKNTKLTPLIKEEDDIEENVQSNTRLPIGLKPLVNDPYLESRHFLKEHYEEFEPSYTKSVLEETLAKHNYIIFKIKEGDRVVAWLARSRYNKTWHDNNRTLFKEGIGKMVLRYMNSQDGFSHILGGCNFIGPETETVILVEGLFDKVNVDYLINLGFNQEIACCFTFGKKISPGQLNQLRKTNVKTVILMYDEDALRESKETALHLSKFFNVKVCRIKDKDVDPGNMTMQYLQRVLIDMQDPLNFYLNNLDKTIYDTSERKINGKGIF